MFRPGLVAVALGFAVAVGAAGPTSGRVAADYPNPAERPLFERLGLFASPRRAPWPEAGRPAEEKSPGQDRPETGEPERPDFFGLILDPINPARIQRRLDEVFNFDVGDASRGPKAPEIGEPVFFDVVRPLGERKYSNEFNYLLNPSTRNAPTLQVLEYEYVFADGNAVELDLSYFNRNLEILTPFYQRTFGVGRDGNWVHGIQLSADIYVRSKFVGGSAVYVLGWKPDEASKFSALIFAGVNRALIGGFDPIGLIPPGHPGDRTFGAWRPTFNANFFYKVGERVTLGIENDLFCHAGKAGEYLVLPLITWELSDRFFVQAGAGYYRFESVDQATFMLHLNFLNRSPRRQAGVESSPGLPPGAG